MRIRRPRTPTGIGIRLEDPANDPLPTDPDDPRIADDDHDGKPGVTVRIKVTDTISGELYIARREIFAYDVLGQDDGSLTGTVDDHSEQLIVGASDDMFKTEAEWIQHPDPSKSPIILSRSTRAGTARGSWPSATGCSLRLPRSTGSARRGGGYASARRATRTGMTRVVASWYSAYGGYSATLRSHQVAFSSPVTSRAT